MASNNITLTKPRCFYLEVYVLILMKEGNVSASRLASIPLQELKTGSITGVITNQTREKFQLGKVSFLCIINKKSTYNHGEFKLHLKLEIVIPEAATNNPLFDEVDLMVRCLKRNDISSLGTTQEAGHYHLVYSETSKFWYCKAIFVWVTFNSSVISAVTWVHVHVCDLLNIKQPICILIYM